MSLRRSLFLLVAVSTLAVWLVVSLFVYNRLMHEADEIFDAELAQYSRLLMAVVKANAEPDNLAELQHALPESPFKEFPKVHALVDRYIESPGKYERIIGYQLMDIAGVVLLRSEGAPENPLIETGQNGFSNVTVDGTDWRLFSYLDPDLSLILNVAEHYDIRREMSQYILASMLVPVLLGIPLIGLLLWLSLSRGLRPLTDLAKEVRKRDPDALVPFDTETTPAEITPLVNSLNRLLGRLDKTLEKERQFTGDAAHELRTPLAALRVQSQVALNSCDNEQERAALEKIILAVDRMSHLVNQLLTLSQLDGQQVVKTSTEVPLVSVAEEIAQELAPAATEHRVSLDVSGDADLCVRGDRSLLSALLRNLVDNAIRYGKKDGTVNVDLSDSGENIVLTTQDDGPGIPANELEAAFDRFHRYAQSGSDGAGLGLSIARKICDLHGADIELRSPDHCGLLVIVRFSHPKSERK